jgi:hypothetical protein
MSARLRGSGLLVAAGAVCFAPAFGCLWLISAHAVDLPTGDEWDAMVPAMVELADGDFPWARVVALDNEHRLIVPHLIQLLFAKISGYDNRVELYFGWLCLLGVSVLFLLEWQRERPITPRLLLSFLPVNVVIFTFRQCENLIFAYQINVLLAIFLATLTFSLLSRPLGRVRLGLAVVTAILATYSHLLGLLVFPIGMVQLLIAHRRADPDADSVAKRAALSSAVVWAVCGALAVSAYFVDYGLPGYHPSPTHALSRPLDGAAYLLAALGSPWAVEPMTAVATGALVCVGYALVAWELRERRIATLLGPAILLSLGCAAMVAIGRSGYGDLGLAIPLRYTTYATPGLAALYSWAVLCAPTLPSAKAVLGAWLAVAFVATPLVTQLGLDYAREQRAFRWSVAEGLRSHADLTDAQLALVCPWDPARIRVLAPALERVGWSVFRDAPSPRDPALRGSTRFTIDVINGVLARDRPVPIRAPEVVVEGWAVDDAAGAPAGGVRVVIDGQRATAAYGHARPDVASAYHRRAYRGSGFRATLPTASLAPGIHRVAVEVIAADGHGRYVLSSPASIEVSP